MPSPNFVITHRLHVWACRVKEQSLPFLREIAAAKVSEYVAKIEDIDNIDALDVPNDIVPYIRRAFNASKKVTTCSQYLYEETCCIGCASFASLNLLESPDI